MTEPISSVESPGPSNRVRSATAAALRHIRWWRVAGELSLIVIGVLVGLAINNWYAGVQLRRNEAGMLRELRDALTVDLTTLRQVDASARSREARIIAVRSHLLRHAAYSDTLNASFGAVIGTMEVHLNRAPYDALKVKGLDLISNDSLRTALIRLYDQLYARIEQSVDDDRNVTFEVVRPYFLKEFRDIRFSESATPLDYARLAADPYFVNLMDYRLASLRANSIVPVESAISSVTSLLGSLQRIPE